MKKILLVNNECPECADTLTKLDVQIKNHEIEVIKEETEAGKKLSKDLKVREVPIIVIEENEKVQKCFIGKDFDIAYCMDGSEIDL